MFELSELLELKRWNIPTIYNGREQITKKDAAKERLKQIEAASAVFRSAAKQKFGSK